MLHISARTMISNQPKPILRLLRSHMVMNSKHLLKNHLTPKEIISYQILEKILISLIQKRILPKWREGLIPHLRLKMKKRLRETTLFHILAKIKTSSILKRISKMLKQQLVTSSKPNPMGKEVTRIFKLVQMFN